MHRDALKKRISVLQHYKDKIDCESDLANHLLKETKKRLSTLNMKFNKINKEVIALSSHFSEGVKSKGILGNIYGYVKFLEKEQEEVNQALKLALTEHERRNDEYKKLKARSLGIEHFIDKCEGMIAAMDDKIETELLDAWFISTQSTKSKKI